MSEERTYRVLALHAENVKRIEVVDITPGDGPTLTFTGPNGAGKSSCLDAMAMVFGGQRLCPEEPIRRGADNAVARVELETVPNEEWSADARVDLGGLVMERRWTRGGRSTLRVTARDGARYSSPQAVAEELFGPLSFDPLAFDRMRPRERSELLLGLVGTGDMLAEVRERRAACYESRTEVGRELRRLRGALDQHGSPGEDPGDAVDVAALAGEVAEAERHNATCATARREHREATRTRARAEDVAGAALRRVAELEAELARARTAAERADEDAREAAGLEVLAEAAAERAVERDASAVLARLREADTRNARVRAYRAHAELAAAHAAKEAETAELEAALASLDADRARIVAEASYPVPGLTCDEEGVRLDGVPWEQASQAQRLVAALEVGWALNPRLRVMLVRDASLLDEASLAVVAESAERHGGQVWLERVWVEAGEPCVVIEEGRVRV